MRNLTLLFFLVYCLILVTFPPLAKTQISISKDELPLTIGTSWATLNDTTESVIVDVGLPGENQHWEFNEDINGIEITQSIVEPSSTPFSGDFQDANYVMKYEGSLLDMIYSDVFPEIKGDVYFYQLITDSSMNLLGTGFNSSFLSGAARFNPPNVILNYLPTKYGDEWITKSIFDIVKDTTILGISGEFRLSVNDSAYSLIDAWGTISIPFGDFDCLRMKSYVTMNEKVTFNGAIITQKIARVVNYNWLVKDYGMVMRVASHTAEPSDNFTDARLYSRMTSFMPGPTLVKNQIPLKPISMTLLQNYPNPFNPSTSITYSLAQNDMVSLAIYNQLGQEVRTLVPYSVNEAGEHRIEWNGDNNLGTKVPSGIYYCQLKSNTGVVTRSMSMVK